MKTTARQEIPDNYVRFWQFDLSKVRELFWLNLASLGLFFVALLGFAFLTFWLRPEAFALQSHYHRIPVPQLLLFLAEVFAVTAVMLVLHEALHGVFFWIYTHSKPKFAFKIYYAYAAAPGWYFPRRQYFLIALAPLIVITLLGILGILFLPKVLLLPINMLIIF